MARITVIGGTGYAGTHIVREAATRGHQVRSLSRSVPTEPIDGVAYTEGSVLDDAAVAVALDGADVVAAAVSPRGDMAGQVRPAYARLAAAAQQRGVRLAVVGGAASLQVAEGGPRLLDTPEFPDAFKDEASEFAGILDELRAAPGELDWFYLSPAGTFGAYAPGEDTGSYRVGGDVLVTDDAGRSEISGPDFARAVVDEIEEPAHRRTRFTVAH
ncbi:NAD(P)H-binding protein [Isoptericola halotolerans]|uniref:NAD(P)-dependent oxidoreductase n=1 Tax=Isoptericola halotolerans TaxID=300560 RepID=UPI00388DA8F9